MGISVDNYLLKQHIQAAMDQPEYILQHHHGNKGIDIEVTLSQGDMREAAESWISTRNVIERAAPKMARGIPTVGFKCYHRLISAIKL